MTPQDSSQYEVSPQQRAWLEVASKLRSAKTPQNGTTQCQDAKSEETSRSTERRE